MYLAKTPSVVKPVYRDLVWNVKTTEKVLYLTFDDGPIPDITPQVIKLLANHNAKATFFCIGENVHLYPEIFEALKADGHAVGNHTHNHLNGWKTGDYAYFRNALTSAKLIESDLFRPPYGRIKRSQSAVLKSRYKIVMWDVLSGDFDPQTSNEQCLSNVTNNAKPGSIIVFHDSLKAGEKMLYALPKVLEHFAGLGFRFECLKSALSKES